MLTEDRPPARIIAGTVVMSSSTMIRGFVSARRPRSCRASTRSCAGACRPRRPMRRPCVPGELSITASATTSAQISTESATCEHDAHGCSLENTLAAPTSICARAARARASTSAHELVGARRASCARGSRSRATRNAAPSASTRCANIAVAAPSSAGTSLPSISGQSVNASRLAASRADVGPHQQQRAGRGGRRRSREVARSPDRPPRRRRSPARASAATTTTSAMNASATAKWAVTHHGLSSRVDDDRRRAPPGRARAGTPRGAATSERCVDLLGVRATTRPRRSRAQDDHDRTRAAGARTRSASGRRRSGKLPGTHCGPRGAAEARPRAANEAADGEQHDGDGGGGEGERQEAGHMASGDAGHDRPAPATGSAEPLAGTGLRYCRP